MAKIRTYNKIAEPGIAVLRNRNHEVGADVEPPHGILVRSAKLHDMTFNPELMAVARAGAGVNNIPIEACTDRGIVVFNTPGSNANSVKELVIAALLLASRRIIQGHNWVQTLTEGDVAAQVEKGKSSFAGPEISGKTLGVVGLGAIGVMVANAGEALGMRVVGYDPYLSVESAWGLSRSVERAQSLESLLGMADYLTLHAPLIEETKGLINSQTLAKAKPGVRILNFARGGLVDTPAVVTALKDGKVSAYVTDFPTNELVGVEGAITIPHLGASTPEAEDNSAVMAAQQLADYIELGTIRNSVNFPTCEMERNGGTRILIANRNVPNMVGQISTVLAGSGINIADMLNRHRGDVAYNIIDIDGDVDEETLTRLRGIEGIMFVRVVRA